MGTVVVVVGLGEAALSKYVVGDQQKFKAGRVLSCFDVPRQIVVSGVSSSFAGSTPTEICLITVSLHLPLSFVYFTVYVPAPGYKWEAVAFVLSELPSPKDQ